MTHFDVENVTRIAGEVAREDPHRRLANTDAPFISPVQFDRTKRRPQINCLKRGAWGPRGKSLMWICHD